MRIWKSYFYILLSYGVALGIGFVSFVFFKDQFSLLISTLLADIIATGIIFIFSIVINNSSVYDPYWSLIPIFIIILWIVKLESEPFTTGLILSSFLIWGIRLTFNWMVNWEGFKDEDWRYIFFRQKFGKLYWLVSLLGIHMFPTLMVFLGMIPIYYALNQQDSPNHFILLFGFVVTLIAVLLAFFADRDLRRHRLSGTSHQAIRIGVWKYSRHPNYLGEILFWFGCFIMGLAYGMTFLFTGIGFVAMVILFECYSIPAMEKRLLKSKTNYLEVIHTVPKLIPIFYKKS